MLLLIINSAYQKDANYYIALTLIQERHQLESLSITALARLCQTSVSSVNKFCKMLGAQSFSDLKYNLNKGFIVRKEQMAFRLSKMNEEEMLSNIAYHAQQAFDKAAFKTSVEHLVEIIKSSPSVQLIGAYFPTSLAINFQEDMITMDKLVYVQPQKRIIEADPLSNQDLILLITLTGRLYEYAKNDFDRLCQTHRHIALISGFADYPKYPAIEGLVKMPIVEDNEIGNILILETFRYIKYMYFHKYVKELS